MNKFSQYGTKTYVNIPVSILYRNFINGDKIAAPVPPKKDVTDEELKKEFGIHLAQRLGSDESKEAKWADIDDDDDDWVPEAIEWNDGMKVTLEDTTATIEETVVSPPATYVEPVHPEPVKQVSPSLSPFHTPAVPVKEEVKSKTLITERPTPKSAEPLLTHPVRASPWARVPPSATSPTAAVSAHLRSNDFPSRHEPVSKLSLQHTSVSTGVKEVSADVYDRSWRDRPVNHSPRERELFNSETGQLEPVREMRNGGIRPNRNDAPMNKPSVLQRPVGLQYTQQSGPAEPSAAFQQSRSSISFHRPEEYGRRRASSNVSGGSGSTGGRRPSFSTSRFSADQPPIADDARFSIDPRRGSFGYNNNPFDNDGPRNGQGQTGPYSPQFQHFVPHPREISPRMAVASPILDRSGPPVTQPPTIQQMLSFPPPPHIVIPDYEDPIAQQERVMKESRESAKKRRQEVKEEAKEETEKQERLKIKLEILAEQAKLKEEEEAAKVKIIEERAEAEKKAAEENRRVEEKAAAEMAGRVASERRAEEAAAAARTVEARQALERGPRQVPLPDRQVRIPPSAFVRSQSPGNSTGISNAPQWQGRRQSGAIQSQRSPTKNFAVLGNREPRDQPWKNVPPGQDRYTSWGNAPGNNSQTQNSTDGNPWGPIGEKPRFTGFNAVGNGTFDNRYFGFSSRSGAPNPMHNQQNRDDKRLSRSGPISPGFSRGSRGNDSISHEDRAQAVSRWNTVASTLQTDEAEVRQKKREERLMKESEDTAAGIKKDPVAHPKIVETWRKVVLHDGQGETDRKLIAVSKIERSEAIARRNSLQSVGGLSTQSITTSQSQPAHITHRNNTPAGPASRPASRFFPAAAANLLAQHLGRPSKPVEEPAPKVSSPGSPPPPMSSEHPVHGDRNSRIVLLPPLPQSQQACGRVSPSARPNSSFYKTDNLKLPRPSDVTAFEAIQQKILEMTARPTQKQSPHQQLARPHEQDNKATCCKDFSATKPTYDETPEPIGKPSVSLPGSSHGSKDPSEKGDATGTGEIQIDGGCILSKPDDEEFFHGLFERDFGSTPTVKIPHQAPHIFNNGSISNKSPVATSPKHKRALVKPQFPQTIHMFDPFAHRDFVNGEGKRFVPVHLPGGSQVEVVYKGQEGKRGKKPSWSTKGRSSRFSSSNGHIGRAGGGVSNGRKVAEVAQ